MRPSKIVLLLLVVTSFVFGFDELLQNQEFKLDLQTGLPQAWLLSKGALGERIELSKDKFALQLTNNIPEKRFWWVQHLGKIKIDTTYELNVRIKGNPGTKAYAYVECNKPWKTVVMPKIICNGEWQKATLKFNFTELTHAPYLILCIIGSGKVLFSDPSIKVVPKADFIEILNNNNFEKIRKDGIPNNWSLSKGAIGKRVDAPADSSQQYMLELGNNSKTKPSYWIQHGVEIKPEESYYFTMKIKGDLGTLFRAYIECNKPWRGFGPPNLDCTGKWQTIHFQFRFSELNALPYLVFRLTGIGKVLISEPSLAKLPEIPTAYRFENDFSDWNLKYAKAIESGSSHKKILQLTGVGSGASTVSKKLMLKSGRMYLLTYQVKGGDNSKFTDSQGATWFRLVPMQDKKLISGTGTWLDSFSAWQTKRVTFKASAKDASFVSVELLAEIKEAGSVSFDNITLEEYTVVEKPLEVLMDLPFAYRNSYYADDKTETDVSGIILNRLSLAKEFEIDFNGKKTIVIPTKSTTAFKLPLPSEIQNYPLIVRALDAKHQELAKTSILFTVRKSPNKKVCFRKDRVMLFNNKPFFPLGFWTVHGPKDNAEKIKIMAENGFNIGLCGEDELDVFAENGLFGMVRVINRMPLFSNVDQQKKWSGFYQKQMQKAMANPALAGYFIVDEPAWGGRPVSPIVDAYNLICTIDPSLPIMLNEAPRGKVDSLRDYAAACDVYGVDIYPVPGPNSHSDLKDKMMTSVGLYTEKSLDVVRDRKPIWMTLQGFSWGPLTKKEKPYRYPTHEETRFMAYNAIAHGATGLFWWGINCKNENWDFVRLLGRTVKELKEMSAVLVAPTASRVAMQSSDPEIRILHKICNNKNYYIVLNESGRSLSVKFSGMAEAFFNVLFEKRKIIKVNSIIMDKFLPYDVHIYTDADGLPAPLEQPHFNFKASKKFKSTDDFKNANWIWYPGKYRTSGHRAFFIRDVELESKPAEVKIFITADDSFRCYINGTLMVEHNYNGRGYSTVSVLDISDKIKSGINRIAIQAADGGQAPCGLLFALRLTDADGKVTQIFSDAKTMTTEKVPKGWLEKGFLLDESWIQSEVIGKYGTHAWAYGCRAKPADSSMLGVFDF